MADPGFSLGGFARAPKVVLFHKFFAKNCMETKEFGPPGAHIPGTPLDPPMNYQGHLKFKVKVTLYKCIRRSNGNNINFLSISNISAIYVLHGWYAFEGKAFLLLFTFGILPLFPCLVTRCSFVLCFRDKIICIRAFSTIGITLSRGVRAITFEWVCAQNIVYMTLCFH